MRDVYVIIAVCLVGVAPAAAVSITQTKPFDGTPNYTRTLTFDEFDDQGGTLTLQSVQVSVELTVHNGTLRLDNDGEDPASGTFEFGGKGNISSTDVPLLNLVFQPVTSEVAAIHSDSFSLAGNVGDGASDYSPDPPDGMQYVGVNESDSDSGFIHPTYFGQYTGTGTFDINVSVNQWADFGGVSGIEWAVNPGLADGEVTVVYDFGGGHVPEPVTMIGVLVSCTGLVRYLRRR